MAIRYHYGTGRRKCAVAQVRLYPGEGSIVINGKPAEEYFPIEWYRMRLEEPLKATGTEGSLAVMVKVGGGGKSGQADAVRHGIARALLALDPELRPTLRRAASCMGLETECVTGCPTSPRTTAPLLSRSD